MQRLRRHWPFLFFALLPLLPLWRAVFLGEAIGPFDQLRQMSPWNGPASNQPWDALQADAVLQFHPWRDLVFESWRTGHLPLWNPYELAGTPLLANSQSAGFYPPHIAIGLLHIPTSTGMTLLAWSHLAWAGLGVFLLARRLGAARIGGALGGASFTLSPFMLAWTALPSVIETVSWIPWMLASVVWLFRGPDPRTSEGGDGSPHWIPISPFSSVLRKPRFQDLRSVRPFALLSLSTGMMLLAGHLQFCAYGMMAALIVIACLGLANFKTQKFTILVGLGAMVLGGLIAAPQLLPVLDYGKFSHRRGLPTEEGYQAYVAGALRPFELAAIVVPTALGNPREWLVHGDAKMPAYWAQFVKPGANFAESAISTGPLILSLLFFVPWRRKGLGALASVAGIAFLLAMGTALNRVLYFGVPGWSASGSPARVEVLFVLCACALASTAVAPRAPKWSSRLALVGICLLPCALWWLSMNLIGLADLPESLTPFKPVIDSGRLPQDILGELVGALALLVWTVRLPTESYAYRMMVVTAPVLIAATWCLDIVPTGMPLERLEATNSSRIAAINAHWNIFQTPNAILPSNAAILSRVHEIGGYDSLLHADTVRLLKDIDGKDPAPPENGNMMLIKPTADPARLAAAGVTEIWRRGPDGEILKTPLPGPGRASTPEGSAQFVEESCDGVSIKATGPGPLTLRDRNMPGWNAKVDGEPTAIKSGLWKEVDLPPGEHIVTFTYRPRGVNLWPLSVSLFALLMVLLAKRPASQDT